MADDIDTSVDAPASPTPPGGAYFMDTGSAPMASPYPSWIGKVNVNPQPATKPAMWNTVVQNAASAHVDPDVMWRMFGSERSYQDKPNPFQIMPQTAIGLRRVYPTQNFGDPNDPVEGARMAPWALASSNQGMAKALGRDPNPIEQYAGWVFGPKAVNVLKADPNTPIGQLLPQDWIDRNPNRTAGPDGKPITPVTTAGELRWWIARRMGYDNPYGTKDVGDASDMPKIDTTPQAPAQQPQVDFSDPKGAWSQGITPLRDSSGPVKFDGLQPQVRQGMHALQASFGPYSVSSSTDGGHNDGSFHYRGVAFDTPTAGWSQDKIADFITKARQSGFTGIGIDDRHIHLDMRPGNLTVFKDDHYTGPVGGLDDKGWQAKLAGITPNQNLADQPTSVSLANSRPTMPLTNSEAAVRAAADYSRGYSMAGALSESFLQDSMTNQMLRRMGVPQPDPNFEVTTERLNDPSLKRFSPDEKQFLVSASSEGDFSDRVKDLHAYHDYQEKMAVTGRAGSIAAFIGRQIDPAGWLLMMAPGGGETRLARAVLGAAAGGAGGLTDAAIRSQVDPGFTKDQFLYSAAGGAAFGLLNGLIHTPGPNGKKSPIAPEAAAVQDAAAGVMKSLDRRYASDGTPKFVEPLSTAQSAQEALRLEGGVALDGDIAGLGYSLGWRGKLDQIIDAIRGHTGSAGERDLGGDMPPGLSAGLADFVQGWHGSPHEFLKMLYKPFTGEGTMAFGPGAYVAQSKGVGRYYQNLKGPGQLYRTVIKAHHDSFIDWDAGLAGQTPKVRQALEKSGYGADTDLAQFKKDLAPNVDEMRKARVPEDQVQASVKKARDLAEELSHSDVAGTRYLDRQSREGKRKGEAKRNFVVFNPEKHVLLTHRGDESILDAALKDNGIHPREVPQEVKAAALDHMVRNGVHDPIEALNTAIERMHEDVKGRAQQEPVSGDVSSGAGEGSGAGPAEGSGVGEVEPQRPSSLGEPEAPHGPHQGGAGRQVTHLEPTVHTSVLLNRVQEIAPKALTRATEIDHEVQVLRAQAAAAKGHPVAAELLAKVEELEAERTKLNPQLAKAAEQAESEAQAIGLQPTEGLNGPHAPASVGAAATPGTVATMRQETDEWLHSTNKARYNKDKVANPLGLPEKITTNGSLRSSDSPVNFSLGDFGTENRVGARDHSTLPMNTASMEKAHGIHTNLTPVVAQGWTAFKKWASDRGLNIFARSSKWREYAYTVSDAVEERNPQVRAQMSPEVVRAADKMADGFGDYWERMQNPGVHDGTVREPLDGAVGVPKDRHYFPHLWTMDKVADAIRRFGDDGMRKLMRESIAKQFGNRITTAALDKFTETLFQGVKGAAAGQDMSIARILSGDDLGKFAGIMRRYSQASDTEIDSILNLMSKPVEEGKIARLKERTPYNTDHTVSLTDVNTGQQVNMKLKDLQERDAFRVYQSYVGQMEGQLAMARMRVPNARYSEALHGPGGVFEGDVKPWLIDGLARDSQWKKVQEISHDVAFQLGIPRDQNQRELDLFDFVRNNILGRPDKFETTKTAAALRILQNYNLAAVLNQVGFMHPAQAWQAISQAGIKAAWASMPGLRAFVRDARTGQLDDELSRMIEETMGIGTDWTRGSGNPLPTDAFGSDIMNSPWQTAEHVTQRLARTTTAIGGLAPMMTFLQRWTARMAVTRFAMDAAGDMALNANRMATWGLDPAMQKQIQNAIRTYGKIDKTNATDMTALAKLNLDKWPLEVRHAFITSATRWSNKMMQENDIGQMNAIFGTRAGKLITQFRSFMFGAYANNTLHSLHMRDSEALSNVLGSSVIGALSYVAQTHAQSVGRDDREDFLSKKLDLEHIAAAAIHRGGWAAFAPPMIDTALSATGFDPMFDVRASGQSSGGLMSIPAAGLFSKALDASRGTAGSLLRGEPFTQHDLRAWAGISPFGNSLPALWTTNLMANGLPKGDSHKIGKHTQGRF